MREQGEFRCRGFDDMLSGCICLPAMLTVSIAENKTMGMNRIDFSCDFHKSPGEELTPNDFDNLVQMVGIVIGGQHKLVVEREAAAFGMVRRQFPKLFIAGQ